MKQVLPALVIDDDPQVRSFVANILRAEGWAVSEAASAEQALNLLPEKVWVLVICDVMLGDADGYTILRKFNEHVPEARFVLMTGYGTAAGALDATAIGAYDYWVKPFAVDVVLNLSKSVHEQHKTRLQHKTSKTVSPAPGYISDIPLIGNSPKFVECLKMVGRVATTNMPVLITGESGTGKEIVARAIHLRSARADKPFVAVNCGAIPVELIESELFGHAKGAFTGAERDRQGLWEEASEGTIFLDEITETNTLFQVKLLRALQEGEIRRVGSNQNIKIDVRVITASNRDVEEEVKDGRFRQDLMYRLNAMTINLPPLRERAEDIPLLAEHFARLIRPPDASPVRFSAAALKILKNYQWKGNVRELENAVFHAVSLSDNVIYPEHLPASVSQLKKEEPGLENEIEQPAKLSPLDADRWLSLAELEAEYVVRVLDYTNGNKQAAARILGIDRKTLARILNRSNSQI